MQEQGQHRQGTQQEAEHAETLHVLDQLDAPFQTRNLPHHHPAAMPRRSVQLTDDLRQGQKAVGIGKQ
ncbi:hypothetical protein SDC9_159982 [bioreactor metagenome]|uniref:Uncharacterized protein n=1 Tax=bioreactor metagenome TaxID=1076179 RepID=A0A645FKC9_9ZZZZ